MVDERASTTLNGKPVVAVGGRTCGSAHWRTGCIDAGLVATLEAGPTTQVIEEAAEIPVDE
jgi:hypothetical protein